MSPIRDGLKVGGLAGMPESDAERTADGVSPRGRDCVRVMLLISDLERGGAQRQVVELMGSMDRTRFAPVLCSLSRHVPLAEGLSDRARDLIVIEKRWRFDARAVRTVARVLRERAIDIVHAFLFDAEIVARLAGRWAGVPVILSSERNADYRRPVLHSVCLRLTRRWSDGTVANSHAGRRFAMESLGLSARDVSVVPNGVDVGRFRPMGREQAREALGVGRTDFVVGMFASLKPQKNHPMLLRVARRVADATADVRFLCVGQTLPGASNGRGWLASGTGIHRDVLGYAATMRAMAREMKLEDRVRFMEAADVVPLYNACDVTVLTSHHEGTPNVLLESMACGVPVIATRVADNARIVPDGRVGFVVELDDDEAMAERILRVRADAVLRERLGRAARSWVGDEFSTRALAQRMEDVYLSVLWRKRHGRGRAWRA